MPVKDLSVIQFHYLDTSFRFPGRQQLKVFLLDLIRKEGEAVNHINYIFCTDDHLWEINRQYLKHDTYTDIITFHLHNKGEPLLSDIYISIDRVKENALLLNQPFQRELHRVIFHGALHLCGYTDKTKASQAEMRAREDWYLKKYFSR